MKDSCEKTYLGQFVLELLNLHLLLRVCLKGIKNNLESEKKKNQLWGKYSSVSSVHIFEKGRKPFQVWREAPPLQLFPALLPKNINNMIRIEHKFILKYLIHMSKNSLDPEITNDGKRMNKNLFDIYCNILQ